MKRFDVALAIEHDAEAAVVTMVAFAGEVRTPLEFVRLRPEHNNPIDAIKIATSVKVRDAFDYELEDA